MARERVSVYHIHPPDVQGQSTLLSLAQTCRALCEPALDTLWETQENLVNLVKCLPEDALESTLPTIVEVDDPDADEIMSESTLLSHRANVLSMLHLSRPSRPLLPRLQTLNLPDDAFNFNGHLDILLGPSLRSLMFYDTLSTREGLVPGLVAYAAQVLPNLSHLHLTQTLELTSVRGKLRNIRTLYLELSNDEQQGSDLLAWMTDLPHLNSLTLSNVNYLRIEAVPKSMPPFKALDYLSLYGRALHTVNRLLPMIPSVSLRSLELAAYTSSTAKDVEIALQAVKQCCNPDTMASIRVEVSRQRSRDDGPIRLDCLQYLSGFQKLNDLTVLTPYHLDIEDEELGKLVSAWPSLRTLNLQHPFREPLETKLTLHALMQLASYCPRLQTLHLPLKAELGADHSSRRPGGGCILACLTELEIRTCKTGDPTAIALYLSDICPGDVRFNHLNPLQKWDDVARLMRTLFIARKQERTWAAESSARGERHQTRLLNQPSL
ncbi:hypothetical protein CERSUDRAFT_77732 [Gelatoporia subvermispora B]|uniref:F-box domain-containing protein n=1 Tax=Ceriporiopsis subvermispora (strain B) TaxID=914234 RepID=M2Q5R8_CERS8|nr:hypothetical protein CERSUDRAFT_77732 [Gelatoporia subvermispora B]